MTRGLEIHVIIMITHIRSLVQGVIFQQWFTAVDLRMGGIPEIAGGEEEYQSPYNRGVPHCKFAISNSPWVYVMCYVLSYVVY
jgi:hypothetical protein